MATAFNALVNVQLNAQSLNTASREIRNSLGRITGASSEFQKSLDASTARVFAFGATTLVINGITQSFKALVGTTIEVEKRLIGINAIFGGTESQFQAFRDSIFDVAKKTGQSFSTVADGAEEFARQGLGAAETAKRLEAALVLTNISGLDSVKSVKTLTAAINGFSKAGLDAATITNKIVAVDTKFAVSAQDLADALSRAGSTAEDAGVSFDELLGLIAAVEQRTARGGAVIGNAFKSIFTRLSRSSTISELQELGVAINSSQSGVQKLQALSNALDQMSDPNKASQIKELAGSVYQINVVSAALKDLSNQNSVFGQASKASAEATNEGYAKNAELMKSMSAQINGLIVGLTSMAEKVGQLTFAPLLKNLVGIASSVSEFFDKALDPEKGNAFIQGIFKAIGSFISGPGIVLITGAFLRVVSLVSKFAKEGFQSVMKIGSAEEKIQNINAGITRELLENEKFRKAILDKTLTQEQKEQLINKTILERNKLYNDQKMLLEAISRVALKSGVTGYESGVGYVNKKNKPIVKARGFAPSFAETVAETSAAREHGYKAGTVYNTRLYDGSGGSFKATVNSAETVKTVRGANGKLGTYVIPPNGLHGKGFVPNYAAVKARVGVPRQEGGAVLLERYNINSQEDLEKYRNPDKTKTSYIIGGKEIAKSQIQNSLDARIRKVARSGMREKIDASGFGMLIPKLRHNENITGHVGSFKDGKNSVPFILDNMAIRGPNVPNAVDQVADPKDERIKSNIWKQVISSATSFANLLGGPKIAQNQLSARLLKQKGAKGAINSAVGAAFEAAVLSSFSYENMSESGTNALNKIGGDFDLRGAGPQVKKLFQSENLSTFDFKASASKDNLNSMAAKIYRERNAGKNSGKANMASGFIPNFASYVYDSDRIPADKGATLKAILASKTKKNLLIAPSGAGKSTAAAKLGKFLTGASDVSKASEINLLSGAARAKGGGISKQLESLLDYVNASGGKVSYLHVKNMEIMKRRMGRASLEGDLRSEKQLKGTKFAPLNQFDFVKAVKSKAKRFEVLNAGGGFIPNFVTKPQEMGDGAYARFFRLGKKTIGKDKQGNDKKIDVGVKKFKDFSPNRLIEDEWLKSQYLNTFKQKVEGGYASLVPATFFPRNLSTLGMSLKKRRITKQVINDPLATKTLGSQKARDFGHSILRPAIASKAGIDILDLHGSNYTTNDAAAKAVNEMDFTPPYSYDATAVMSQMAAKGARFGVFDVGASTVTETVKKYMDKIKSAELAKDAQKGIGKAGGFMPNFSAVGDAINREKAAGVPSSKIYLDSSPQLRSSRNPMGMMVANSLDEPSGGFQGINRARKEGRNPKTYGASGGFVPNYAPNSTPIGNVTRGDVGKLKISDTEIAAFNKGLKDIAIRLAKNVISLDQANKEINALSKISGLSTKAQDRLLKSGRDLVAQHNQKVIAVKAETSAIILTKKGNEKLAKQLNKVYLEYNKSAKSAADLANAQKKAAAVLSKSSLSTKQQQKIVSSTASLAPNARKRSGLLGKKIQVGELGAIFGLSAVAGLVGEAKETDSNLVAASKQIIGTTAQFASAGAAFGPLGAAAGALTGILVTGFKAITGIAEADAQIRKNIEDSKRVAEARSFLKSETIDLGNGKTYVSKGIEGRVFESSTAKNLGIERFSDINRINKKEKLGLDFSFVKDAEKKAVDARIKALDLSFKASQSKDPKVIKDSEESKKEARKLEEEYGDALRKAIEQIRVGNRSKNIGKIIDQFGSEFARTAYLIKNANDELDQKISNLELLGGIETKPNDPYSSALKTRQTRASDAEIALRDRGAVDEEFNSPLFVDAVKEAVTGFKKYSFAEMNTGLPEPFSKDPVDRIKRRIPPKPIDTRPREKIGGFNLVPLSEYKPFDRNEFERVLGARELTFEEAKTKLNFNSTELGRKAIGATAFDPKNGLRKTLGELGIDTTKGAGLKFSEAVTPKLQKASDSIKKTVISTVNNITRLNAGLEELDKKIAENVPNLFNSITKGFSGKKLGTANFAKNLSLAINEKDPDTQRKRFASLAPQASEIESELGTEFFTNILKSVAGKDFDKIYSQLSAEAAASQFKKGDILDNSRRFLSGQGRAQVSKAEKQLDSDPTNKSKIDNLINSLKRNVSKKNQEKIAPIIASLEARKSTNFGEKGQKDLEAEKDALKKEMADAESHLATLNSVFGDSQLPSAITALSLAMHKAAKEVNTFKDMAAAMESLNSEAVTKMIEAQGAIKSLSYEIEQIKNKPNPLKAD